MRQSISRNTSVPGENVDVIRPRARRRSRASRGQILILFAGALVALLGMVGLGTDLGYALAQRRTMQNAADAGAMAGAWVIAKSDPTVPTSVIAQVKAAVAANELGGATPTVTSCVYVDDNDQDLGTCSASIPSVAPYIATGVRVTVKETHTTFFLRAIPGGPSSISTGAGATAHVQYLDTPPGDGPFLVCGVGTKLDSGGISDPVLGNSSDGVLTQDASGNWEVNPAAIYDGTNNNPKYQVFGPNITTCGLNPQNYKGQAVGTNNENLMVPNWFTFANGDAAGHVSVSVNGVDGCTPAKVINCVAFLPVAVDNPPPDTSNNTMWTVKILPFYLTAVSYSNGNLNKIDGALMGDYIAQGVGKPGFIPGTHEALVIRLTK